MSGLWWLQLGWKNALCRMCGVNIWDSGGDPDHGICYGCFMERHGPQEKYPPCEICGQTESCATGNGYLVCSEQCHVDAMAREPKAVRA